jgi:methyltransferase-like protein/trans-aconitate methyltransferase
MQDNRQIELSIARNARSYDLLPYESKPLPQTHPARLAAIGKIFGLEAKPMPKARVLELGCASGGNLVPMAMSFPGAQFVGVDISPKQVAAGQARIEKLGLKNLDLQCKSFSDLGADAGEFDYIICHGVFSWVPLVLQNSIFQICKKHLSPEGIAYVSYNVLPGWRMIQPLRDAFQAALPEDLEGEIKVQEAVRLLSFLSVASPSKAVYAQSLKSMMEKVDKFSIAYIAHEYLEDTNDPCLFRDFAGRAAAFGLGFLGESELPSMIVDRYDSTVADEIRQRAAGDAVATEQLLDLVSGRTFRQTLLVHGDRLKEIDRSLAPDCLNDLYLEADIGMRLETADKEAKLTLADGQTFWINSQPMREALTEFISRLPASSTVESLLAKESDAGDIRRGFCNLMLAGAIVPSTQPVKAAKPTPWKPKASQMARADAEAGAKVTANLKHEPVLLEPATWFLLRHMDGKHDQSELTAALVEEFREGRIFLYEDGKGVSSSPEAAMIFVQQNAVHLFEGLARAALLVA